MRYKMSFRIRTEFSEERELLKKMREPILPIAMLLIFVPAALGEVVVSIDPTSQTTSIGRLVTADIDIAGLGIPPSIGTFDLDISYNPLVLAFSGFAFGDPLVGDQLDPTGNGDVISSVNPGIGTLEIFELSLDSSSTLNSLQHSSFTLGALTFNAVGTGDSALDMSINALGDADGNPLTATIQDGAVSLTSAIPEPETGGVFSLAVVLLLLRAKFRKASRWQSVNLKPSVAASRFKLRGKSNHRFIC
jgi:hypothetical protein